jgi:hypothetical protein
MLRLNTFCRRSLAPCQKMNKGAYGRKSMFRIVLLSLGAVLLFGSAAQAHGYHADCRVGDSRMGVVPHFHPGGYGGAQPCGGGGRGRGYGGGYDDGYADPGYQRMPRRGDFGPQTNRGQDCYNYYGRRICCPKGWTVQDGQCQPYRGR